MSGHQRIGREEQAETCTIVELIALWATAVMDTYHFASTECTAGKNPNINHNYI